MPKSAIPRLSRAVTKIPYALLPADLQSHVHYWHEQISRAPMKTYDRLSAYQRAYWQYLTKIAAKELSPSTPFRKGQ